MIDIIPIQGCDYIRSNGHIDEKAGIFGVLDEAFTKVKTGNIVPAINNTRCIYRKTQYCPTCHSSVQGFQASGMTTFRKPK